MFHGVGTMWAKSQKCERSELYLRVDTGVSLEWEGAVGIEAVGIVTHSRIYVPSAVNCSWGTN